MSEVVDRFMRYVQIDSQSDEAHEDVTPSTDIQHAMARLLEQELIELGCTDAHADEHAYVIATFAASADKQDVEPLMLCAHMDSASDACAQNIHPQILHYETGKLSIGNGVSITPEDTPDLVKFEGQDLITTDGTTLLSADDKAGIAEIMTLLSRLKQHPEISHPTLKIVFVPDEEIGHGAALLDIEKLGTTRGYTVDGEVLGEIGYECFSASQATISAHGVGVHPGAAKNVMINALSALARFDTYIGDAERPETTEGYEGFYHLIALTGDTVDAQATYILRDFNTEHLHEREAYLQSICDMLNKKYGKTVLSVSIKDQYRNMAEKFVGNMELIDNALCANAEVGIDATPLPIRGGTDGAQLTLRGLRCPNLATGGYNAHGVREFIPVKSLEITVDMLQALVQKF